MGNFPRFLEEFAMETAGDETSAVKKSPGSGKIFLGHAVGTP